MIICCCAFRSTSGDFCDAALSDCQFRLSIQVSVYLFFSFRAKVSSRGNKSEPSQGEKRSRRQPPRKKSASVVGSKVLPNKKVNQAIDGKNTKKMPDDYDAENVGEGMKLRSAENEKTNHIGKVGEHRKSLGKRKSEDMPSIHRKRPSSTPLYHCDVDEPMGSGRFNRLENKRSVAAKSSFKPTELPEDFPVDENKEELVDDNVAKPQVKQKVRRKRIQRVTYPTKKKKIKVEKLDEDYKCKEEFGNNGNEADGEATQYHGKRLVAQTNRGH